MIELINISGQQFYYSTIHQVIERCSEKKSCAIIIDKSHLNEFLEKGENIIGEYVSQIIIISENVDAAIAKLEGVAVLLIAAESFEEAIRIVILGEALSKGIVCIPKEDESTIGEIIDIIVT